MTKILSSPRLKNTTDKQSRREQPKLFKVFLHNDDYTTMDFVVEILEKVFHKNNTEAISLMLQVHQRGMALCGIYPFEIAETRVDKVHKEARQAGFPLRCSLDPE